jgi:arginase family enzyme
MKIADLGNILPGHTINDTYFALSSAMAEVMARNAVPIVIGGGHDLTFGMYRGYEEIGRIINLACIDPMFDLGDSEGQIDSSSYLSKIIMHQPSYLFNYTNIAFQSYLIDTESLGLMRNLFFDAYRLGHVQANIEGTEPLVRNADMLSIDIGSVRASDAPGNANAQPNGLYGEELCRIIRYAGLSDKVSSLGFFEYNPKYDAQNQTARLIAEAIWYFVDGFYGRQEDYPREGSGDYVKFNVTLKEFEEDLTFFKSKKSDRWWMKVPFRTKNIAKYERHHMVPCSHSDYEMAMSNNIPDRWWMTYQKLM